MQKLFENFSPENSLFFERHLVCKGSETVKPVEPIRVASFHSIATTSNLPGAAKKPNEPKRNLETKSGSKKQKKLRPKVAVKPATGERVKEGTKRVARKKEVAKHHSRERRRRLRLSVETPYLEKMDKLFQGFEKDSQKLRDFILGHLGYKSGGYKHWNEDFVAYFQPNESDETGDKTNVQKKYMHYIGALQIHLNSLSLPNMKPLTVDGKFGGKTMGMLVAYYNSKIKDKKNSLSISTDIGEGYVGVGGKSVVEKAKKSESMENLIKEVAVERFKSYGDAYASAYKNNINKFQTFSGRFKLPSNPSIDISNTKSLFINFVSSLLKKGKSQEDVKKIMLDMKGLNSLADWIAFFGYYNDVYNLNLDLEEMAPGYKSNTKLRVSVKPAKSKETSKVSPEIKKGVEKLVGTMVDEMEWKRDNGIGEFWHVSIDSAKKELLSEVVKFRGELLNQLLPIEDIDMIDKEYTRHGSAPRVMFSYFKRIDSRMSKVAAEYHRIKSNPLIHDDVKMKRLENIFVSLSMMKKEVLDDLQKVIKEYYGFEKNKLLVQLKKDFSNKLLSAVGRYYFPPGFNIQDKSEELIWGELKKLSRYFDSNQLINGKISSSVLNKFFSTVPRRVFKDNNELKQSSLFRDEGSKEKLGAYLVKYNIFGKEAFEIVNAMIYINNVNDFNKEKERISDNFLSSRLKFLEEFDKKSVAEIKKKWNKKIKAL